MAQSPGDDRIAMELASPENVAAALLTMTGAADVTRIAINDSVVGLARSGGLPKQG
jgi:hypothetical protein